MKAEIIANYIVDLSVGYTRNLRSVDTVVILVHIGNAVAKLLPVLHILL